MRVGIVSDIHSNLPALTAVLADMGQVEELWCLGDIVGYGPYPNECVEVLAQRGCLGIPGNHDWACLGKVPVDDFNTDARRAVEWTRGVLEQPQVQFLETLPITRTVGDFTLAHGTPHDPIWEYMAYPSMAKLSLHYFASRYCLVGHTHVPLIFLDGGTLDPESVNPVANQSLELPSARAIFNPGSVGQPRDGNPQAAYAVLDTTRGAIDFRRVAYDVGEIQSRMKALNFPERLVKRLAYGW
ncbi:MAG: metallophosphoesterase family protein [Chloroflexota bacterium]